jgi:hypothetical protein
VAAGLIERANARAVCQIFTQSLARYGSPEELLTDNGKVFTGRLGPHPGEVLFDRICREQGITHLLTGVRCPTTTGKIERFHKTLRAELLTGRRFDSLPEAQQVLDAWVADYNLRRPHQALAMVVPAERFQPATASPSLAPGRPLQPARPATLSPTEVTRRVSASGLIGVCYQQVSAGRHLAGQVVTVRLHPTVLQVFFAGPLIRTVPRRSTKEVVQLRAHRPTGRDDDPRPTRECQPSPGTKTGKPQPELDTLRGRSTLLQQDRIPHRGRHRRPSYPDRAAARARSICR